MYMKQPKHFSNADKLNRLIDNVNSSQLGEAQ